MEINKNISIIDGGIAKDHIYTNLIEMFLDFSDEEKLKELVFIHSGVTETITYGELQKQAIKIATNLKKNNIKSHANIVFVAESKKEFLTLLWGIIFAGCVAVPASGIQKGMTYSEDNNVVSHLKYTYSLTESKILLAGDSDYKEIKKSGIFKNEELFSYSDLLNNIDEKYEKPIINGEEPALIMFTSGSTAKPKGAVISHSNAIAGFNLVELEYNCDSESCIVNWMGFSHVGGIFCNHLAMVYCRAKQVHIDAADITKDVSFWLQVLSKYKATHMLSPNFAYALILENEEKIKSLDIDLSALERCISGGESISLKTCKKVIEIFRSKKADKVIMIPAYGSTEVIIGAYNCKLDYSQDVVFVSVGVPPLGMKVRITDENDNILETGKQGILQLKGPSIIKKYYNDVENTKLAFTDNGWFRSGDLGYIKDGQLFISGREKDIAIINGANYACLEIENLLKKVEGVSGTVACIPYREISMKTDQIVIFYNTDTPENLEKHQEISDAMAKLMLNYYGVSFTYSIPLKLSDFPKTAFGKTDKRKLKELFLSGTLKPIKIDKKNFAQDYKELQMLELWKSILNTENLSPTDKFYSIGGNSLNSIALVEAINEKFGCQIEIKDLFANSSIREILQFIY